MPSRRDDEQDQAAQCRASMTDVRPVAVVEERPADPAQAAQDAGDAGEA